MNHPPGKSAAMPVRACYIAGAAQAPATANANTMANCTARSATVIAARSEAVPFMTMKRRAGLDGDSSWATAVAPHRRWHHLSTPNRPFIVSRRWTA